MQPKTITEAGFFNCVIECIAGGDSCVLTVGDFIRNQPVANMISGGQMSLRLSLATTSQRVDSMMGCYQPYNLLFFNLIYKTKRRNIEVNNRGSSDDSECMLSTSYAGTISPPRCAKIQEQRVARRPGGEWSRQTTLPAAIWFRQWPAVDNTIHMFQTWRPQILASHLNQKLCYKPHNFVPIYLPTPVHTILVQERSLPSQPCPCGRSFSELISRTIPALRVQRPNLVFTYEYTKDTQRCQRTLEKGKETDSMTCASTGFRHAERVASWSSHHIAAALVILSEHTSEHVWVPRIVQSPPVRGRASLIAAPRHPQRPASSEGQGRLLWPGR